MVLGREAFCLWLQMSVPKLNSTVQYSSCDEENWTRRNHLDLSKQVELHQRRGNGGTYDCRRAMMFAPGRPVVIVEFAGCYRVPLPSVYEIPLNKWKPPQSQIYFARSEVPLFAHILPHALLGGFLLRR